MKLPLRIPLAAPEPWASHTDVLTASQYLERAIHSRSRAQAYYWLMRGANQLRHAADYLRGAGYPGHAESAELAALGMQGMAIRGYQVPVAQWPDWAAHQLYLYQAVLAGLDQDIQSLARVAGYYVVQIGPAANGSG